MPESGFTESLQPQIKFPSFQLGPSELLPWDLSLFGAGARDKIGGETVAAHTRRSPEQAAELIRHNLRISELERTVSGLIRRMEALEHAGARLIANPIYDPPIAKLVEVTKDVFGVETISIDVQVDPADPGIPITVVEVNWDGAPSEVVARRIKWHRQLSNLTPGNSGIIRLSINQVRS
ncbi:MAG: hypothetical protein K8T91_18225 [Planctomycetes bacterium]|nr:hypothetical protein [Planctomycetota bacterium]